MFSTASSHSESCGLFKEISTSVMLGHVACPLDSQRVQRGLLAFNREMNSASQKVEEKKGKSGLLASRLGFTASYENDFTSLMFIRQLSSSIDFLTIHFISRERLGDYIAKTFLDLTGSNLHCYIQISMLC